MSLTERTRTQRPVLLLARVLRARNAKSDATPEPTDRLARLDVILNAILLFLNASHHTLQISDFRLKSDACTMTKHL